jgi:hypothetical protein
VSQPTALLLTLAVEVPLYVAALVALRLARFWPALALAVLVNALTHPVLWQTLGPHPALARVAVAEVVVWLVEAAILGLAIRRRPTLIALLAAGANAASILAGALIAGAS